MNSFFHLGFSGFMTACFCQLFITCWWSFLVYFSSELSTRKVVLSGPPFFLWVIYKACWVLCTASDLQRLAATAKQLFLYKKSRFCGSRWLILPHQNLFWHLPSCLGSLCPRSPAPVILWICAVFAHFCPRAIHVELVHRWSVSTPIELSAWPRQVYIDHCRLGNEEESAHWSDSYYSTRAPGNSNNCKKRSCDFSQPCHTTELETCDR